MTPDDTLTCCELACYEDPGCSCEGCAPSPDAPGLPSADEMVEMGCPPEAAWDIANARAALAVAPSPDALDAERLARALRRMAQHIDGLTDEEMEPVVAIMLPGAHPDDLAAAIAREYAALDPETPA